MGNAGQLAGSRIACGQDASLLTKITQMYEKYDVGLLDVMLLKELQILVYIFSAIQNR